MPKQETPEVEPKEIILADGEVFQTIGTEQFRSLSQPDMAAALVKIKRLSDFFRKLFLEWEPILRTRMDMAREDSTQVNQIEVEPGVKVHLGAGKEDKTLTQAEIESMFGEWTRLDGKGAEECFEVIHKVKKAEVTKYRKQRGEPGSMERKRSEMIERYYCSAPKKLEIK